MKRLILAALAAATLALPACDYGEWEPTPGAKLTLGASVTAANPLPADVDCQSIDHGTTTWKDMPIYKVVDFPSDTSVTVQSKGVLLDVRTVDRSCVTPFTLQR